MDDNQQRQLKSILNQSCIMKGLKLSLNKRVKEFFVTFLTSSIFLSGCGLYGGVSGDPAAPKYVAEDTILTVITEEAQAAGITLSPSAESITITLKGLPRDTAVLTIDFMDEHNDIGFAYVNEEEKGSIFYEPISDLDDVVLLENFENHVGLYKVADNDISICIVDAIEEKGYSPKKLRKSLQAFFSWRNQQDNNNFL